MSVAWRGDLRQVTGDLHLLLGKKVCKILTSNIRVIVDAHVMVKLNCKGSALRKAII